MSPFPLTSTSLLDYNRYLSLLAGNDAFVPPPTSAYDLLATEILTGPQTSVTFSNLNNYSTDYKHLQIRMVVKGSRTGGNHEFYYTVNGGSSYWNHYLVGNGSTVGSGNFSYSKMFLAQFPGSDLANIYSAGVMDILDPFETNKNKTIRTLFGGTADGVRITLASSLAPSTAAVNSISFGMEPAGSFVSGTRFSLYGTKAVA